VAAVQATAVQGGSEERTAGARGLQSLQVGVVAHTAGRKDRAAASVGHRAGESAQRGAARAGDPGERHHDQSLWPKIWARFQTRGAEKGGPAEIKGKYHVASTAGCDLVQQKLIAECLAANYHDTEIVFL